MAKKILLVDDDESHLILTREVLELEGFSVEATTSAPEALLWLKTKSYDLIISDLHMPEMQGTDFIRQAAEIRDGQKAIILTGKAETESFIESIYGIGALEYIVKPIEAKEFVIMVDKLTHDENDLTSEG